MLATELKTKSAEELHVLVGELEAQLRAHRFGLATRQAAKVSLAQVLKRDLARVKTALSQLRHA